MCLQSLALLLCVALINAQDASPITIQLSIQPNNQVPNQLTNALYTDISDYQPSWSQAWFKVLRISNNQTSIYMAIDCASDATFTVNPRAIFKQFVSDCCLTSDGCSQCDSQSSFYSNDTNYAVFSTLESVSVQCSNGEFRTALSACPSSSASQNYIAIIGSVIGAVLCVIMAMIGVWVYRSKQQQSKARHSQGLKLNDSYQGVKVSPPQRDSVTRSIVPITTEANAADPPLSHAIDVSERKKRAHRRAASTATLNSETGQSNNQRLSIQVPYEGPGFIAVEEPDTAVVVSPVQPEAEENRPKTAETLDSAGTTADIVGELPKPLAKPHRHHHRSNSVQVHQRQRSVSQGQPSNPSTPPPNVTDQPVQAHKRGRSMMLSASQRQALANEQTQSGSGSNDGSHRPSMISATRAKSSSFDTPAIQTRLPSVSEPSHSHSHHHHHHHHQKPSSAGLNADAPQATNQTIEPSAHHHGRHQRKKSNMMHQRQASKIELPTLPTLPDTAE